MSLTDYNDLGRRLSIVCDHYLDLAAGLRDSEGKKAIWPCPACGSSSFEASFETGSAGCLSDECQLPASIDLLELIAYLDPGLEPSDRQCAGQRFSEILEESINQEQHRQHQRSEQRQRAREERRWQKGLQRQRAKQQGETEDTLF